MDAKKLTNRLVGMELYKARKELKNLIIRVVRKNGRDIPVDDVFYDEKRVNVSVLDKHNNIPSDSVSDNAFIFRVLSIH